MPTKRTKGQLAAIAQADAILKTAEDKQIERINAAIAQSFASLKKQLDAKWSVYESGDTFATDRGILLAAELKEALNVLDPKSMRTKAIKNQFKELLTLADINGNQLAGQLLFSYTDDRGLAVDSTVSSSLDVIAEASQEAYDRLLKYGQDFANQSSIIIQQGIIQGWGAKKTATALAAQTGATRSKAEMLVRTESGKATTRATKKRYQKEGISLIQHIATQDTRVCPYCAARAGNIYPLDGYDPILHPNCRCTQIPVREEWIEAGLFDLEWAEEHSKDAIAKAGSTNNGQSPFEKKNGIPAPIPWWKAGKELPARQKSKESDRALAIAQLVSDDFTEDLKLISGFNSFVENSVFKQDHKPKPIKGVKSWKPEKIGRIMQSVKFTASDGVKDYEAKWTLINHPRQAGYQPGYKVNKNLLEALKTLGANGNMYSVSVAIDGRVNDPRRLSEKQSVRRAIANKRAWDSILESIPEGTLLHNDPVGGAGGKRARFYSKNGFGSMGASGQYGLVIVDNGLKKVIPVNVDPPMPKQPSFSVPSEDLAVGADVTSGLSIDEIIRQILGE